MKTFRVARPLVVGLGIMLVAGVAFAYVWLRPQASRLVAYYTSGVAVVKLDDRPPVTFQLVDHGALFEAPDGAVLAWKTANGWYLNLIGRNATARGEQLSAWSITGTLQVDAYQDRRWAGLDGERCAITFSDLSVTRIAGSVRCQGLTWYDASSVEKVEALDLPPFDLDATFEDTGDGTLPSPGPR